MANANLTQAVTHVISNLGSVEALSGVGLGIACVSLIAIGVALGLTWRSWREIKGQAREVSMQINEAQQDHVITSEELAGIKQAVNKLADHVTRSENNIKMIDVIVKNILPQAVQNAVVGPATAVAESDCEAGIDKELITKMT